MQTPEVDSPPASRRHRDLLAGEAARIAVQALRHLAAVEGRDEVAYHDRIYAILKPGPAKDGKAEPGRLNVNPVGCYGC